ncbi:MAG: hypothetical protein ABSF08_11675 [Candidatus Cybelea sp.]
MRNNPRAVNVGRTGERRGVNLIPAYPQLGNTIRTTPLQCPAIQ